MGKLYEIKKTLDNSCVDPIPTRTSMFQSFSLQLQLPWLTKYTSDTGSTRPRSTLHQGFISPALAVCVQGPFPKFVW